MLDRTVVTGEDYGGIVVQAVVLERLDDSADHFVDHCDHLAVTDSERHTLGNRGIGVDQIFVGI